MSFLPPNKTSQPLCRYMENQSNHWDVQLRGEDALWMKQLWADLVASGVLLDGGRTVQSKSDVLKWIAQQYKKSVRIPDKKGVDKS